MQLSEIISRAKLDDRNIINAYAYGSRVYGNFRKDSDYDFIFVVKKREVEQFSDNLININFFEEEGHKHRLFEHEISALECQFLDPLHILVERKKFTFKKDLNKLRHTLSAKSSNSWVKAKKKLTVPGSYDLDLGRKSLFHAFRIIEYGKQIATNDKITSYDSCNNLFKEIMQYYEWEELFEIYKQRYNQLCTEFRILAPKVSQPPFLLLHFPFLLNQIFQLHHLEFET